MNEGNREMRRSVWGLMVSAALVTFAATAVQAATITISTSDDLVRPGMDNQGWWVNGDINNNATNDNYIINGDFRRDYFTFSLDELVDTVIGATLRVRRYNSDSGVTLNLFDVSTSAADLARRQIIDNSVFIDLGTGNSYGSFLIGAGVSSDILSFSLNATALADINAAAGGYFSIGGQLNSGTLFGSSSGEPGNSAGTQNSIQELVLTTLDAPVAVPEPGSLVLLSAGLLGLGWARHRNRRV
jgi:hypothetical protein